MRATVLTDSLALLAIAMAAALILVGAGYFD